MPIYTINRCTIEVAKGRQSATATRHETGETKEFRVLPFVDAPTPEVQAQYWAKEMPEWKAPATAEKLTTLLDCLDPEVAKRYEGDTDLEGENGQ